MKNIYDLKDLGYKVENYENRIFRIKNGYGDLIASIFTHSGIVLIQEGKIFNYRQEVQKSIKTEKYFFKVPKNEKVY